MPERRARMLSVEESAVVSVPVVAPDNWLREGAPTSAVAARATPARPRFLSEDEDSAHEESDAPAFFSASGSREAQYVELAEAPAYTPLPRDFALDFGSASRGSTAADETAAKPASGGISEAAEAAERDLDVPAFMRRLQF
jgi:cell division protein FtsZ